jgi:hypothetical protein
MSEEEIVRVLKQLNNRISEVELRLDRVEGNRIIFDERKIMAREREIDGKTYFSTPNGGILKEVRIPFCDVCGRKEEDFNICTSCHHKICNSCSISYRNQIYCKYCLSEILPLTKEEYKVLLGIFHGLKTIEELNKVTKIKEAEIRACIESLTKKEFIENSSFLFFFDVKILEKGLEALTVYRQLYGREEDVIQLESEVMARSENI